MSFWFMACSPADCHFFGTVYPLKGQQLLKTCSSFGIHLPVFRGFIPPSLVIPYHSISHPCLIMCVSGIHAVGVSVYPLKLFMVIMVQQKRPVATLFFVNSEFYLFFFTDWTHCLKEYVQNVPEFIWTLVQSPWQCFMCEHITQTFETVWKMDLRSFSVPNVVRSLAALWRNPRLLWKRSLIT